MKLWVRLSVAMIGLVVLTAAAVGWLTNRNLEEAILPRAIERIETHIRLLIANLDSYAGTARADIAGFRSAVALDGLIRAKIAGGADPNDLITEAQWRQRMAARYVAELESKPAYSQFRVIGVADGGRELVRVDRSGPNGAIRVVPDADLQRKGDRDYFIETMRLPPGGIYVSRIDLNQENGKIEVPHVPVMRVATPVQTPTGEPFGIVIINVEMRPVFELIRSTARPGGAIYVINDRGDYLVHPDRTKEFGFDLGKPFRWQDDFAQVATTLKLGGDGSQIYLDAAGERGGIAMNTEPLAGGPSVTVIETVPNATIMAAAGSVRRSSLLVGIGAVLAAAILAIVVARSLAGSLTQMTRGVERFATGDPVDLPTEAGGEIGTLARAFARVMRESREKTAAIQHEAEERRRANDVLNNTIGSMVDPVLVVDEKGDIVLSNPAAQEVMSVMPGMTPQSWGEMYQMFLPDRVTPVAFEQRPVMRAVAGEVVEGCEVSLKRVVDGKYIDLIANGGPIRDSASKVTGAVVVYHDVTEIKNTERQLRQAQKMEAVGQLTGGIAHDFNNILTVITGTIEIMAAGVADKPELVAIAKMIDEAATRGAELTQGLLSFARRQPLQPRKTDVNALIVESAKLLRPTLGENVEIEALLDSDSWPAMIDATQLTGALINLALNARDAMPKGGKLAIETGNVFLDEAYASAHAEVVPGPYLMIAVSDTGVGIPAALRDRVFEPFFTTKETGRGTGLGLSMVFGFIKQSGGHIKIYSEEGHGTVVKMYLPPAVGEDSIESDAKVVSFADGGAEVILVVEDDALVRTYVCAQLASMGYTPVPAADAAEALAIVDRGERFDMLFTDVIMPGSMNGSLLAAEVKKRRPGIAVLFTSGYTETAIVHHGRLDSGVLLLAKPYRKSDLARMIRTALTAGPSRA